MLNVAMVGLGDWGPNIARNLAVLPDVQLHTLCDLSETQLARLERVFPAARRESDVRKVLVDPDVDAIVVATPVHTHFEMAAEALRAGKHVLVEKPLARTSAECRELIELARARRLILMAGHVFVYNPAVRRVKEFIESGELGDIYYVYSQRLNLGRVRQDVNALWNFAPHDVSILAFWLGAMPERVTARGYSYIQPGIEDVVFMTLDFPGGVGANVHISWLDPRKVRCMTVVGSKKMLVYDDVSADARIVVYDKGVSRRAGTSSQAPGGSLGRYGTFGEFELLLRAGDGFIPKLDFVEPLKLECERFVEAIRTGKPVETDGENGRRVVCVLEAAERALRSGGVEAVTP